MQLYDKNNVSFTPRLFDQSPVTFKYTKKNYTVLGCHCYAGRTPGADTVMPVSVWLVIGRGGVILLAEKWLPFACIDYMEYVSDHIAVCCVCGASAFLNSKCSFSFCLVKICNEKPVLNT